MSIINQIYNLEPVITHYQSYTRAELIYKGRIYSGVSMCHPIDKEFESPLVGANIATSRAIIWILKDELDIARIEAHCLERIFKEMYYNSGLTNEAFSKKIEKANKKVKIYREALKKEKKALNGYIKDLNTTFNHIKKNRTKGEASSVEE